MYTNYNNYNRIRSIIKNNDHIVNNNSYNNNNHNIINNCNNADHKISSNNQS